MLNLESLARKMEARAIKTRRSLHRHPELKWEEDWTIGFITRAVERSIKAKRRPDIEVYQKRLEGGLVVDVTVNPAFPRVLLRADVDALPIQEATGLAFTSTKKGIMHACGHDAHSAILLAAFEAVMKTPKFPFAHNLRFVWQRAEENPIGISGGRVLVMGEDVCRDIIAAYALHLITDTSNGVFSSRAGALLGNSGRLGMTIRTGGGHVAEPHEGANALRVVQAVMNAMDQLGATILPPTEPRVLEPVIVNSGTASNVRPSEAIIWYGARTMLPQEEHVKFMEAVEVIVNHVVSSFPGANVEFDRVLGHPATINNPDIVQHTASTLVENNQRYCEHTPMLGGEDFAYYLQKVPGAMFMLGAGQEGSGPIHSPTFNPDESVFWRGVHFWLLVASTRI